MNCRMFLTPPFVGSFIFLVLPTNCPSAISTNELVQLMDKKDWTTSRSVAELVADRGTEAIPPLIDILQHGDEIAKDSAMMVIRRLKASCAIPVLIELLAYRDFKEGGGWISALMASRTLVEFGAGAVEPLLNVVSENSGNARRMAIRTLGEIDDEHAVRALRNIFSNTDDPHWSEAARHLGRRDDDVGLSVLKLAETDDKVWKAVQDVSIGRRDEKRLISLSFKKAKLKNHALSHDGMQGIARNAGNAELPRIFEESLDQTWVLPFVEINAAIEGLESESAQADVLWRFVIRLQSEDQYDNRWMEGPTCLPLYESENPIEYGIERLARLGDFALSQIESVLDALRLEVSRNEQREIELKAIAVLTRLPPSEASTNLMLKTLSIVQERIAYAGPVIKALGDRRERRAVPSLIKLLDSSDSHIGLVIEALNNIGDRTALEPLLAKLSEKWSQNRGWSPTIVTVFNQWDVADASWISVIVDATSSRSHGDGHYGALYYDKLAAFLSLVRIGKPSIEALRSLTVSGDDRSYTDRITRELAQTALIILQQN